MRQKSEVFTVYKKFKTFVEKRSDHFINGEYTSKEFDNFNQYKGVERQLAVRYRDGKSYVI